MKHYIRIYLALIKLNVASLFAYRSNFYNALVISTGWGVISVGAIVLLTAKTSSVYGWSRNELLLLSGIYSIITGVFHIFFSSNFERFSEVIHYGRMDGFLLKPVDEQFLLTCTIFRPVTIIRFILGIVFCIFILSLMHRSVTLMTVVSFFILCLASVMLLYAIWFSVVTLTIWFTTLSNLVDFLYNASNLGRYPSEILTKTGSIFAFLLIPLTFIASIPAKQLIGKATVVDVSTLFIFSCGFFFLSRKFWKFALRHYTSASS